MSAVVVGALEFQLHLPDVHSLKEKRAVVRPIVDGARHRYAVSAAEVGHQDKWQRAELGFACVAGVESHVREVLEAVERFVWSFPEVEVVDSSLRWMEVDS
jgi:uncharacterized protein YlxP (DUF503 family)